MATAVLRSRDCVSGRLFYISPSAPEKPSRRTHGRPKPRPAARRVSFAGDSDSDTVIKFPSRHLVMEEVTILKRGEDLHSVRPSPPLASDDLTLCSTQRLGPEPESLAAPIRFAMAPPQNFAGPACFSSPAPSALPFPSLFVKRDAADVATKSLLGLLRLDNCS